jgi:threonine dehydrogenase-like Zn-dependent dehydrogenase
MRSAVLVAPRQIETARLEAPRPRQGEVLMRVEGCGLCASSLPVFQGRQWFSYPCDPGVPGHEGWGTVEEVGAQVEGWQPGDRAAFLSQRAFSELDTAPADALVRLPPELDGRPFPGEAVGCAWNVFERAGIVAGQQVAVLGIGFLGSLLVTLCRSAGAHVVALSRRAFSRELALSRGAEAAWPLEPQDGIDPIAEALEPTRGAGFERVIECCGTQSALDAATGLCAVRGRLVIAAYHQDGRRSVDLQQWNWKGLDVVNAHERDVTRYRSGMDQAVRAAAAGLIDLDPLLSHEFPLDRLGDAFGVAENRPAGFIKGWIRT